ncbi:MAG: hypothetical protein AMJ42_01915 [Deltaproteobacteria bacterium DG_8]|nr:MAG: hypothetical protein AMJ42_01915 [Deltaproteobacteria bacterium DG_8]
MNLNNTPESTNCKNHPTVASGWQCNSCQNYFCDQCIKVLNLRNETLRVCPQCKGLCRALESDEQAVKPFLEQLPGAFSYPFKGKGKILLISGAILFGITELILSLSLFKFIFMFFIGGYLIAYMFNIIESSASGNEELPDWPDFSDFWGDIIRPMLLVFTTTLVCLSPAIIYLVRSGQELSPTDPLLCIAIVAGLLYFPMGLLAVALFNRILALNPLLVVSSILKVPLEYLIACVVLPLVYVASMFGEGLFGSITFLGHILSCFFSLYFMMVEARILGLIYYANKNRLRWI